MRDLNVLALPDLFAELTGRGALARILDAARREDLGDAGDVTTAAIIPGDAMASAIVTARRAGVVAGMAAVPAVLRAFESGAEAETLARDGARCAAGEALCRIRGRRRDILAVERTLLNIVGRMCGVATLTRLHVDAVAGTKAAICDTRKTMPGLRCLDKYAVRCGGGTLHRIGLFDAALFKDNHLAHVPPEDFGSAVADAARRVRRGAPLRFVEVEVASLGQMEQALAIEPGLVDIVLLDNMPRGELKAAVGMRNEHGANVLLEASGGVTLDTVRDIAATGVDRISIGALTHSAPWFDVGLEIE
jgi:nicotinate-nucleotide pyrophosphorylase (carboxylating)